MILATTEKEHSVGTVTSASALAGGICGFVVDMICHPIDTMKTRMQAAPRGSRSFSAIVGSNWRSTFAGISTNFVSFPACFVYFGVYERGKYHTEELFQNNSHVFIAHLISGSMAEVSSIMVR